MKSRIGMAITFFVLFGFVFHSYAQTLQEDYKKLEEKRQAIEKKRIDYENKVKEITSRLNTTSSELNQCIYENRRRTLSTNRQEIYEKWRVLWESRLKEAEIARETSEEERHLLARKWREIMGIRKKLEDVRSDIEKKHTEKGPGSKYETEFRQYMENLESTYFARVENDLFNGYQDYLISSEGYLRFLKNSLALCQEGTDVIENKDMNTTVENEDTDITEHNEE